MTKKTTAAQRRASRKWEKNNKERTRYLNARRGARYFIKNYAELEDFDELEKLIEEKKKTFKNT